MRKSFVFIIGILSLILLFPVGLSAEEAEQSNDQDEYNELGIKKGTEVYGEDISELSEEELQYVPEGWRDGEFESEHPEEQVQRRSFFIQSVYPDVNEYIKSIDTANIEYEHKDFFTKFNYRGGHGAVEGVVAHETANDASNITGEISWMSRNHLNAFVHAFIDHERIIQIHPPDYGAWGGGRYANERFVHVELVRVENFDQFARSINNYADYIAGILYNYNLGVSDAENSGKGSLWSHKAVSIHLGGTTHVDPHGYFARYGYSWNEFVSLVMERHNDLVAAQKANTSKLGHIGSSNVRIYENPMNLGSYETAAMKYTNEVFYIKAEAKVDGTVYYLLSRQPSSKNGTIGWVKATDISVHAHEGIDSDKKTFTVKGTGKAYNKAWGGPENEVYSDLSSMTGETFHVNLTESVGNNVWYRGTLGGKTAWIHSSYVSNIVESNTSKLGHIKNAEVEISHEIYGDSFQAGSSYTNKVYYIKKEATANGDTFYLISDKPSRTNGVVGWVNAEDMSVHDHSGIDKGSKNFIVKGSGKAYTKAWGGSKDLVYNLSSHAGETFKVNLTEAVGNNVWYRGMLDGKQVWMHESYVTTYEESRTSKLGHIKDADVEIHTSLYPSGSTFKAGTKYTHAVYYIKKQATFNDQIYYLISTQPSDTEGVVGWVGASDLSIHPHTGVDSMDKTFYFKGTGSAYSKAWGGSKDLVHEDMSQFENQKFNVHLTEEVGSNTWYRGNFKGETIWLHTSYLMEKEESSTSKLGHLHSGSTIYEAIGETSTAFSSENYLNAVYYIKKQAELNGHRYYLISTQPSATEGIVGWVNEREMSTYNHVGVDRDNKTFTFKGTGSAYNTAWGGSKDLTFPELAQFKGQEFHVHLTEKVGSNIWYRGDFNGERIWVHSSYVD
ncbi:N-acetylmuramoyl-L-alanine amidase family protein [Lentibacillus sediminis]|uniref:peptidoglycan recognition protein family protein n=1 Tax=Lentibacillus sediminis TaxID=1940529 RepID=UPI00130472C9|nr:GW dipeptide domain-containing protein [Lentibacillus sediminis]